MRHWCIAAAALLVALSAAGLTSGPAAAAMRAILQLDNDGHDTLVVMQDGSIKGPMMSFSCTRGRETFGISLHLPDHESWPVDGEMVAVKAGGETLITQRFAASGKYLIWGGSTARSAWKKVLAYDAITVTTVGIEMPFAFPEIGPQIGRWREVCGMT